MARPKSYTEHDIIAAVQALRDAGKTVNGTNLRLHIGKGRPDALMADCERLINSGAIQKVEKQQEVAVVTPELEQKPLPPEVADSLSLALSEIEAMVRMCNDKAHAVNEQRVAGEIKQARQKAEIAQAEALESSKELDKALLALGITEEAQAEAEDELSALKANFKQLKVNFDAEKAEKEALTQTNKKISAENADNTKKLAAMQTKLELETQKLEATKAQLSEVKAESRAKVDAVSAEKAKLAEKLAKLEQQHDHVTKQQENMKLRDEKQSSMIQDLKTQVATLAAKNEQIEPLNQQITGLNQHIEKLTALLDKQPKNGA